MCKLRQWQAKPTTPPTHTTIPLGISDDNLTYRLGGIMSAMLVFDYALDANKLRGALEQLIDQPGWRKLGARLRRNASNRLECVIPDTFTPDRPAIRFSQVEYNIDRASHAVASHIPSPTTQPAVTVDPKHLEALTGNKNYPKDVNGFLKNDMPVLGLHVVKFIDSTIVTISWPHVLFDLMALSDIIKAWTAILQRRESIITAPSRFHVDTLLSTGTNTAHHHHLDEHRMSWPQAICVGLRTAFRFLISPAEHHMVYVPAPYIQKLHSSALKSLENCSHRNIFISECDVLCAWWTRLFFAELQHKPNKKVTIANALSIRSVLPPDLFDPGSCLLENATSFAFVVTRVKDVTSPHIEKPAALIRESINSLRTLEQVQAYAKMWSKNWKGALPLFGTSETHVLFYSNWEKGKLFDMDFSGAAIEKNLSKNTLQPSYIQSFASGLQSMDYVIVVGKDNAGGYWLDCNTTQAWWKRIRKILGSSDFYTY